MVVVTSFASLFIVAGKREAVPAYAGLGRGPAAGEAVMAAPYGRRTAGTGRAWQDRCAQTPLTADRERP